MLHAALEVVSAHECSLQQGQDTAYSPRLASPFSKRTGTCSSLCRQVSETLHAALEVVSAHESALEQGQDTAPGMEVDLGQVLGALLDPLVRAGYLWEGRGQGQDWEQVIDEAGVEVDLGQVLGALLDSLVRPVGDGGGWEGHARMPRWRQRSSVLTSPRCPGGFWVSLGVGIGLCAHPDCNY